MTTIALAILAAVAVAILVILLIGLIQRQKQSSAQLHALESIEKRLTTVEKALKIRLRQAAEAAEQQKAKRPDDMLRAHQTNSGSKEKYPFKTGGEPEVLNSVSETKKTGREQPEYAGRTDVTEERKPEAPKSGEPERQNSGKHQMKNADKDSETPASAIYNIGKSGKIYTEEELELLIKE